MDCIGEFLIRPCSACKQYKLCKEKVKNKGFLSEKELELADLLLKVRTEGKRLSNQYFGSDQWIEYNKESRRFEYEDHVPIGTNIMQVIRFYREPYQSWSLNSEWKLLD